MRKILISAILFAGIAAGCKPQTETFSEIYGKDLNKVTAVYLTKGDGTTKDIKDKSKVKDFLAKLKNVKFITDKNQEKGAGYAYSIKLFEGKKETLFFDTSRIKDYNFHSDPDVASIADEAWGK
ncbi:hypothetical protein J9317_05855 [Metabacillus sp. KIGAM252]|uniref:Uncharacterized protein n=1 Tax=Metabacillus flavus TaxID=2823519 RepID=A0ABS5LC14_9BACI|nr:hypothetical protein [Metabacillus flavus]MBS2968281.1 hypothetical protein [Metabacillus flavus]